jgi:hypothetical protein
MSAYPCLYRDAEPCPLLAGVPVGARRAYPPGGITLCRTQVLAAFSFTKHRITSFDPDKHYIRLIVRSRCSTVLNPLYPWEGISPLGAAGAAHSPRGTGRGAGMALWSRLLCTFVHCCTYSHHRMIRELAPFALYRDARLAGLRAHRWPGSQRPEGPS